MRLSEYLQSNNLTSADLAAKIGNVTSEAVRLWATGKRVPRAEQMRRIVEVTEGQVTPNDFLMDHQFIVSRGVYEAACKLSNQVE